MKKEIVDFLKNKVLGIQLFTDEVIYTLEEGKLEGVYSDRMIFSDLTESENGFQFNMTTVTEENVYLKEADGNRGEMIKDFTGTGVFHYELAFRQSTSEFTGYMRLLSSSTKDHTMEAVVYGVHDVEFENGELRWKEKQLMYRDTPAGKDKYRPVAFDAKVRFYMEESKMRFEYTPIYWYVEPKIMKKTLSKDQYPPFVAKEK